MLARRVGAVGAVGVVVAVLGLSACTGSTPCGPCLGEEDGADGGVPKNDGAIPQGDGSGPMVDSGAPPGSCTFAGPFSDGTPDGCKSSIETCSAHEYQYQCNGAGDCSCVMDSMTVASVTIAGACTMGTCYIASACGFPVGQCE